MGNCIWQINKTILFKEVITMSVDVGQLLESIESTRERMLFLASNSSINDNQVVQVSIELDDLLNKYFSLTMKP